MSVSHIGVTLHHISLWPIRGSYLQRWSLLVKKIRAATISPRITFSDEDSPLAGRVKNIILADWNVLKSDPSLKNISSVPLLIMFKRCRNLRDKLVHSDSKKYPILYPGCLINLQDFFVVTTMENVLTQRTLSTLHILVLVENTEILHKFQKHTCCLHAEMYR